MAYLGNGIYDLLDVIKASKDPSIAYEGLYQDPRRDDTTYYGGDLKTYPYGMTDASGAQALISSAFPQEYGVGSLFDPRVGRPEKSIYYKYQPDFINAPQDDYASLYSTQPDFINAPQDDYASLYSLPELDTSRFKGMDLESGYLDRAGSSDQDVYSEKPKSFRDSKTLEEYFQNRSPLQGIEKLMSYLPFGEKSLIGYLADKILPKDSPEIRSMKNFYRSQYGLTDTGQVASGIMAGYNPVSGGLLNMLTGGRFGEPTRFGLANAARQRIENIAKRRAPQTDASRAKIAELQRFAEADTISRARQAAPDVYRDAGNKGTLGPGGGFSTSGREGAFSSKSGRGRQDF